MSDLVQYWPNAEYIGDDGRTQRLFTYDSALTEAKARKTIDVWKNDYHYKLVRAWIDIVTGDILDDIRERIEVEV